MNRRRFLTTAGTAAAMSLAGCSDSTGGERFQPTETAGSGPEGAVPGTADIYNIQHIDEDTLVLGVVNRSTPRDVTFKLYAQYPTKETPAGGWETNTFANDNKRPRLRYPDTHRELISETVVSPESGEKIPLDHGEVPAGVPIQYQVELVEHTLDGQSRHLGTTGQVVRNDKTGEFTTSRTTNAGKVLRTFVGETVSNHYTQHQDDSGTYQVNALGATNNTRFHTPLIDSIPNRTNEVGREEYRHGAFERFWTINYSITQDEFQQARDHNRQNYIGHINGDGELGNIRRAYYDYLDDDNADEVDLSSIERIAETFAAKAEVLGFTTPEEKVRFVADYLQWLPYEHDDVRGEKNIPNVQHPICTLARARGDCEDKTIALAAILYQDVFPDYKLSMYFWDNSGGSIENHFGLAIKNDIWETDLGGPGSGEHDHTYIEATYPAPLATAHPQNGGLTFLASVSPPTYEPDE